MMHLRHVTKLVAIAGGLLLGLAVHCGCPSPALASSAPPASLQAGR